MAIKTPPTRTRKTRRGAAPLATEVALDGVPLVEEIPDVAAESEIDPVATPDDVGVLSAVGHDLVEELPEEVLSFLVRSAPTREVWNWLNDEHRRELLAKVTRGFQRTANVVRQPAVRNRLVQHLSADSEAVADFLRLWGEARPEPHAITDVRAVTDDAELVAQLPELWKQHGGEALLLALLLDDRRAALEALDAVAEQTIVDELADAKSQGGSDPAPDEPSESELLEQALAEAATWRGQAISAQNALNVAQESLRQVEGVLSAAREQHRREAHAQQTRLKQEQHRMSATEENLQETKRVFDRTARRLKSSEKETAELLAESKRLKRQLRHQQQLNEELRKQLANVTARLQSLETSKEAAKPATTVAPVPAPVAKVPRNPLLKPTPVAVSPLDQPFVWKSDGRPFQVTPREVKRAIDRNDEEFVFTLIQAFDALRETNEAGYRMFLGRVREFDRYYSRVLTVDTTRVLIDASNVARYESDRYGKGQLRHLLSMRDELRRRDCFPILIYADASLPYHIDETQELLAMVKRGEVQLTASGQEADEVLAREARRTGAYVVTNDRSFHTKVSPDFEPPRITFRVFDGVLIVDDF